MLTSVLNYSDPIHDKIPPLLLSKSVKFLEGNNSSTTSSESSKKNFVELPSLPPYLKKKTNKLADILIMPISMLFCLLRYIGCLVKKGGIKVLAFLKPLILTAKIASDFLFIIFVFQPVVGYVICSAIATSIFSAKLIDQYLFNNFFSKNTYIPLLVLKEIINLLLDTISLTFTNIMKLGLKKGLKDSIIITFNKLKAFVPNIMLEYHLMQVNYSDLCEQSSKIVSWSFNIFTPIKSYKKLSKFINKRNDNPDKVILSFVDNFQILCLEKVPNFYINEVLKASNLVKSDRVLKETKSSCNFKKSILWLENFLYSQDLEVLSKKLNNNTQFLKKLKDKISEKESNIFIPFLFHVKGEVTEINFIEYSKALHIIAAYLQVNVNSFITEPGQENLFSINNPEECYSRALVYFSTQAADDSQDNQLAIEERIKGLTLFLQILQPQLEKDLTETAKKNLYSIYNPLNSYKSILEDKSLNLSEKSLNALDMHFQSYLVDALYIFNCESYIKGVSMVKDINFQQLFNKEEFTIPISSKAEAIVLEKFIKSGNFSIILFLIHSIKNLGKEFLDIKALLLGILGFKVLKNSKVLKVLNEVFEPFDRIKERMLNIPTLVSKRAKSAYFKLDNIYEPKDKLNDFCALTKNFETKNFPTSPFISEVTAFSQLKYDLSLVFLVLKYNLINPFINLSLSFTPSALLNKLDKVQPIYLTTKEL